jgi:CRISPR type IV-associated protein Csf2
MKDEVKRDFLTKEAKEGEKIKSQMQYYTETIAAGTVFYWKICLIDTNDMETGAFLDVLQQFANTPYVLGGNGRIGLGDIKVEIVSTKTTDSDVDFKNDDFVQYVDVYRSGKKDVSHYFETGKASDLIG